MRPRRSLLVALALVAVACGPPGPPPGGGGGSLPPPVDNSAGNLSDPTNLPLGDYHVVATGPTVGAVYRCGITGGGGGAFTDGPWIRSNGTWDSTSKLAVQGSVAWPTANVTFTVAGDRRILTGNALPVGATTGVFPIQASDPAYQYDRNPNTIRNQTVSVSLPLNPTVASAGRCVNPGPIGYALNGVAFFDALDGGGRDAVAHEVQDSCQGHPEMTGLYHYHSMSICIPGAGNHTPTLIGYAADGFGIYNSWDADGRELTNADLDACHGTTSAVPWNGSVQSVYHYVATRAFPYTVGCYRG